MVRIDIIDYLNDQKEKYKNKSFEETKKDLDEIDQFNFIFKKLENSSLFKLENSKYVDNDLLMQTRLLISEIKEKQDIIEKLNSLGYYVGLLRAAILTNDDKNLTKTINNILKNEYSSINSIIADLNLFRNKIDKLEKLHSRILEKSSISLDMQLLFEEDFSNKHKLYMLYDKQKNILLNLSNIFIKLTKESIIKNKKK